LLSGYVSFITVTAVDSGSKALEFLGLLEDEHNDALAPSVSLNDHHQVHAYFIWTWYHIHF